MLNKSKTPTPATITHPDYDAMLTTWIKFRLTYEGGEAFKDEYLEQFSTRENSDDYHERAKISYVPAHAKSAVNDVKNAIFQRMIDITRKGGPISYKEAITGLNGGVDLTGNSMDSFIGRLVLPELLTMAKVGVYVDKERVDNILDLRALRPYLYMYKIEDIRSWAYDSHNQLKALLLRDHVDNVEERYGLILGEKIEYRLLRRTEKGIEVSFYTEGGVEIEEKRIILNLTQIPFVMMEIGTSLLTDIADYQIALMNMSSGDVNYACKSNFPFYTEQYLPQAEMQYLRQAASDADNEAGTAGAAKIAKDKEIKVGTTKGRRYPKGLERPGFIHPSAEPLQASMEKQEKMKQEIRQLINLAITNIEPRRASAESKQLDERGLESGLSYIGMELEYGEREIARIWSEYESRRNPDVATIYYPKKYSLKTEDDRRKEARELTLQAAEIPSKRYQKETLKEVVEITMGYKVSTETLEEMKDEIDRAEVLIIDSKTINMDLENGLVSRETASQARLYPKGEVEKASMEHAERLARIAIAQTEGAAARGILDQDPEGRKGAKDEKKNIKKENTDA